MKALLSSLTTMLAKAPAGVRLRFVQTLSGKDNTTFDIARLGLFGVILAFLGLAVYHAVATKTWDPAAFGIGAATVLGGGAAGVRIKASTEPDAPAAPADDKAA